MGWGGLCLSVCLPAPAAAPAAASAHVSVSVSVFVSLSLCLAVCLSVALSVSLSLPYANTRQCTIHARVCADTRSRWVMPMVCMRACVCVSRPSPTKLFPSSASTTAVGYTSPVKRLGGKGNASDGAGARAGAGGRAPAYSQATGASLACGAAFELAANRSEGYNAASVGKASGGGGGALATLSVHEGVNGMVLELFKAIDTNLDGSLTEDDFSNFGQTTGNEEYAAEAWLKLASKFDDDNDGSITLAEFHNGVKYAGLTSAMAGTLDFVAPADWTMEQWCNEFGGVLSRSVAKECTVLKGWFQSYDGVKSAMRSKSTKAERQQNTAVANVPLHAEPQSQLQALFGVLDADNSGTLEAADFATLSKNEGTATFWTELKANFDSDGDETITFDEFSARIVSTVYSRVAVGFSAAPTKEWTWSRMLAYLVEWSNALVCEQAAEIFDYHVHGEYGAEDSPEVAALSATFGSGFHFGGNPKSTLLGSVAMPLSAAMGHGLQAAYSPGAGAPAAAAAPNVPLAFAPRQPPYVPYAPTAVAAALPLPLPARAFLPPTLPPPALAPQQQRPRIVHIIRGNRM